MIATLGLISNSTAVVIGAMIVAPLMDPILSLAFGLTISDNRLVKRSAITVADWCAHGGGHGLVAGFCLWSQ